MPFDTVRHSNVQSKPKYRRIGRYYKGVGRYKSEKLRRRKALALQAEGVPLREIALRLGVSQSTVKRDLRKVQRYAKARFNARCLAYDVAFYRELSSLPRKEYEAALVRLHKFASRVRKCKALIITLNVDAALRGHRPVSFKPDLPVQMLDNGRITFEFVIGGRRQILGRVYVQKIANGGLSLQTNDSVKAQIKDVLSGLRIVTLPAANADADFSI